MAVRVLLSEGSADFLNAKLEAHPGFARVLWEFVSCLDLASNKQTESGIDTYKPLTFDAVMEMLSVFFIASGVNTLGVFLENAYEKMLVFFAELFAPVWSSGGEFTFTNALSQLELQQTLLATE